MEERGLTEPVYNFHEWSQAGVVDQASNAGHALISWGLADLGSPASGNALQDKAGGY